MYQKGYVEREIDELLSGVHVKKEPPQVTEEETTQVRVLTKT